jgi:hypothetical protein
MSGILEWLLKLLFIVMLAPFFVCLFVQIAVGAAVVLLPWVIGFCALMVFAGAAGAALVRRRDLPPSRNERFPAGDVPRIRRPRGVRTER